MRKRKQIEGEEGKQLYEPDKILDKKKENRRYYYLVKWKGYNAAQSTWETYKNISHCNWLFEEWEEKQSKELQKKLKYMDSIVDKKYSGTNKVYYLVTFTNGEEETWISRKNLIEKNKDKVQEYEKNEGLLENKRKYNYRPYDRKQDRYRNSDEESNSEGSSSDDDSSDSEGSRSNSEDEKDGNKRGRGRKKQPVKRRGRRQVKNEEDQSGDDSEEQSEDEEENNSESRRIVKAKRGYKRKIMYEKLPYYGILGIDEPKKVKNMVIDKNVGQKNDGYFACDIVWKIRPNKQQPVDSRVSRKDIKEFYPLILIDFYEFNMTYNGDVINAEDGDENEQDDEEYYQALNRKTKKYARNDKDDDDEENEEEDDDEEEEGDEQSDSKSNNSFFYTNHIYYGYAITNEQKKYVKFDEKFFNNNQMEEMD